MKYLFCFLTAVALCGLRARADDPWFTDVAVDGAGRAWALLANGSETLGHLVDEQWTRLPAQNIKGFSPGQLLPLRDGSMGCLWSDHKGGGGFSRHRGNTPPSMVKFKATLSSAVLQELSDGSVLITEKSLIGQKEVYVVRIPVEGEAQVVTIPEAWLLHGPKVKPEWRWFAPICATEDATHRVWLWSYPLEIGSHDWQLPSFVTLDKGKLEKVEVPGVQPTDRISGLLSYDAGHLWYAKVGAGLYSLDLKTMQSELLTPPLPERNGSDNLQYIQQLFREGEDVFALTTPKPWENEPEADEEKGEIEDFHRPPLQFATFDTTTPTARLVRFHQGKWEEILTGVEEAVDFCAYDRPHAMTPAGLLIGNSITGPWLTLRPGRQPPVHLDWRTGFPVPDAKKFQVVGKDKIRVLTHAGKSAEVPIEPLLDPSLAPVRDMRVLLAPLPDTRGNLWGFRTRTTLGKWDGRAWTDLAVPKELALQFETCLWRADNLEEAWIMNDETGAFGVFNFTTGLWQTYRTWEEGMVAQLPRPARATGPTDYYGPPIYSGEREIAFLRWGDGLHFYDGQAWKVWNLHEIAGPQVKVESYPFFDAQRRLCLELSGALYMWDPAAARWSTRAPLPGDHPVKRASSQPGAPSLPEGCNIPATTAARDALGTTWLVSATGRLYKAVPGRTVRLLSETEANPFRDGLNLQQVLIDPLGGALIQPVYYESPCRLIHVPAKLPLPEPYANLREATGDSARIVLSTGLTPPNADGSPAEFWYSWQLDGGPWKPVQKETELRLTDLAAGPHRLLVRSYNAELGCQRIPAFLNWNSPGAAPKLVAVAPAPAKPPALVPGVPLSTTPATVEPKPAPPDPETMRKRVADLGDVTRERRVEAAAFLRAQGPAALPLLEEAKKDGPAEARWWVEKVISEIGEDRKKAADAP